MATFQRAAGGHVAERLQTEPGSDEETRLQRLADDPTSDWRRVDADAATEDDGEPKQPAKSAKQEAWVDWAVSQGADRDAVKDTPRSELIETYGKE